MKLKKSILFWTLIFAAVYLCTDTVTRLCGLRFRIWVREPATLLIAVGAEIGILQFLLCMLSKKTAKIIAAVLWTAAVLAGGAYGFVIFAFYHLEERTTTYDGKACVVETESFLFLGWDNYYEKHGPFFRGMDVLYTYDYDDAQDPLP